MSAKRILTTTVFALYGALALTGCINRDDRQPPPGYEQVSKKDVYKMPPEMLYVEGNWNDKRILLAVESPAECVKLSEAPNEVDGGYIECESDKLGGLIIYVAKSRIDGEVRFFISKPVPSKNASNWRASSPTP